MDPIRIVKLKINNTVDYLLPPIVVEKFLKEVLAMESSKQRLMRLKEQYTSFNQPQNLSIIDFVNTTDYIVRHMENLVFDKKDLKKRNRTFPQMSASPTKERLTVPIQDVQFATPEKTLDNSWINKEVQDDSETTAIEQTPILLPTLSSSHIKNPETVMS